MSAARPPDDGVKVVYCTRFWHKRAGRYIYAPPGRAFRFEIPVKKG